MEVASDCQQFQKSNEMCTALELQKKFLLARDCTIRIRRLDLLMPRQPKAEGRAWCKVRRLSGSCLSLRCLSHSAISCHCRSKMPHSQNCKREVPSNQQEKWCMAGKSTRKSSLLFPGKLNICQLVEVAYIALARRILNEDCTVISFCLLFQGVAGRLAFPSCLHYSNLFTDTLV